MSGIKLRAMSGLHLASCLEIDTKYSVEKQNTYATLCTAILLIVQSLRALGLSSAQEELRNTSPEEATC